MPYQLCFGSRNEGGGAEKAQSRKTEYALLLIFSVLISLGIYEGTMLLIKEKQKNEHHSSNNNSEESNGLSTSTNTRIHNGHKGYSATNTPKTPPTLSPVSESPSDFPSVEPSLAPTADTIEMTTFYAIGDVPYTNKQHIALEEQILNIPYDAEFVIHLGDMRNSSKGVTCEIDDYASVAQTLALSRVPVFIIPGDNDGNDCPNREEGIQMWQNEFRDFDSKYWNHSFDVMHDPERPDNFAFLHKQTFFIGLSIVNDRGENRTEFISILEEELEWTKSIVLNMTTAVYPMIPRIVIFGHADPKRMHRHFFEPLADFFQFQLPTKVPLLYLCGDRHQWFYEPNFYNVSSFLRITVQGQTSDPPLKVMVRANGKYESPEIAYQYDRMLPPGHPALNQTDASVDMNGNSVFY